MASHSHHRLKPSPDLFLIFFLTMPPSRSSKKDTTTTAAKSNKKDAPPKKAPPAAEPVKVAKEAEVLPEGLTGTPASKEILRTVYWSAADKRFDQLSIENDFHFDDESQTILYICDLPARQFPNTHFMRRLAGHLRLGLGRNATKEAILEKICQIHYGSAFTREIETNEASNKRKGDFSTVLKKRPVLMNRSKRPAAEGALKSRAAALNAWSSSLDSINTTIKQAEERLQKLCKSSNLDFFSAMMDRSQISNEYLSTQFAEYDNLLDLQKQMVASMTELGKGNDDGGTLNPVAAAASAAAAALQAAMPTSVAAAAIPAADSQAVEEV